MKIPNGDSAFIDENKLSGYCLNEFHPMGRHKARVFRKARVSDPAILRELLLESICPEESKFLRIDEYGAFDSVAFYYNCALINSIWLIRKEEDFPRLVTCYVV